MNDTALLDNAVITARGHAAQHLTVAGAAVRDAQFVTDKICPVNPANTARIAASPPSITFSCHAFYLHSISVCFQQQTPEPDSAIPAASGSVLPLPSNSVPPPGAPWPSPRSPD